MVLKTASNTACVKSRLTSAQVTLRQVHDLDHDPRRKAALRRLEHVLGAPLDSMPGGSTAWFDAQFPASAMSYGPAAHIKSTWRSVRAYRDRRRAVRYSILQSAPIATHLAAFHPMRLRSLQIAGPFLRARSVRSAADILRHEDSDRMRAHYEVFLRPVACA